MSEALVEKQAQVVDHVGEYRPPETPDEKRRCLLEAVAVMAAADACIFQLRRNVEKYAPHLIEAGALAAQAEWHVKEYLREYDARQKSGS